MSSILQQNNQLSTANVSGLSQVIFETVEIFTRNTIWWNLTSLIADSLRETHQSTEVWLHRWMIEKNHFETPKKKVSEQFISLVIIIIKVGRRFSKIETKKFKNIKATDKFNFLLPDKLLKE